MTAIVLDTCAAIWLSAAAPMSGAARRAIEAAAKIEQLFLSPITGWEVGAKISSGKPGAPELTDTPAVWYAELLALPGMQEAELTGAMALRSAELPWLHRDPADRFLIATAIELQATLLTRDQHIKAYAEAGVVRVMDC